MTPTTSPLRRNKLILQRKGCGSYPENVFVFHILKFSTHIRTVGNLATFGETTRRREHGLRLGALAEVAMATDAARVVAYTADIADCAPGARVLEVGRFNGRGEKTVYFHSVADLVRFDRQ